MEVFKWKSFYNVTEVTIVSLTWEVEDKTKMGHALT